jgi:hypothetical protein
MRLGVRARRLAGDSSEIEALRSQLRDAFEAYDALSAACASCASCNSAAVSSRLGDLGAAAPLAETGAKLYDPFYF